MKSLQETLKAVKDALTAVTEQTYHYRRPVDVKSGYIVWAEDGEETSFYADDRKQEQQIRGTVDYFTLTEFDPLVDQIQDVLDQISGPEGWELASVAYEDETNLIHFEWTFWVA